MMNYLIHVYVIDDYVLCQLFTLFMHYSDDFYDDEYDFYVCHKTVSNFCGAVNRTDIRYFLSIMLYGVCNYATLYKNLCLRELCHPIFCMRIVETKIPPKICVHAMETRNLLCQQ